MALTARPRDPGTPRQPALMDFLDPVVQEHGDLPALRSRLGYRHRSVTFKELARTIHGAAQRLHDAGLRPDERVLLLGPSGPEWVVAFLGAVLAGGVVVPLDESTRPEFAAEVGQRTDARLQVVHTGFANAAGVACLPLESFHPEVRGPAHSFAAPPRQGGDLLEIVYTSGTTSRPKGVLLTHGNVVANVASLRQAMGWPPKSRFLSVLPLSHMLGQVLGLFVPLRFGGTVFFAGTRRRSILRDCFRRERISVLVTVPAFLDRIRQQVLNTAAQQGRSTRLDWALRLAGRLPHRLRRQLFRRIRQEIFPDLQFVFVGGAAVRADAEDFFEALGIHVLQGYGMTEAAPVITCNTMTAQRPRTVGRAVPGVEVRTSPAGEILARGPNVTAGYLNDPEATQKLLTDGWLHTGDLGAVDADGYWQLLGRQKDVLIGPSGMNVYPEDLEQVLDRLPGVRESCVVGLEQDGRLRLVGCVVLKEGAAWDAQRLLVQANDRLAAHQRLQALERWPDPDFPRTRTLKVKRDQVLARCPGSGVAATPAESSAAATDELLALLHDCLGLPRAQPIGDQQRLMADLGMDSLTRLDILSRIEDSYGADLPEAAIDDQTTVADLRRRINEQPGAQARPRFPRWARRPAACLVRNGLGSIWRPLFRRYFPQEVHGTEHLASLAGPVIFIANHTSHLDTPALLAALPAPWCRRVAVAAAADYWFRADPTVRNWLAGAAAASLYHAFPFSRTDAVEMSLRYLGELMDEGWSILLFPEGRRSETGQIVPFKSGIGLIAQRMQVPVVPTALSGCFEALPRHHVLPRRVPLRVVFGPAHQPDLHTDPATVAALLEQRVRQLL
ncbi:MAG: AMP-binding protein [Gemmataceae bacterium]|nr:AMP-binding protein [Gemmataceae bacterium]